MSPLVVVGVLDELVPVLHRTDLNLPACPLRARVVFSHGAALAHPPTFSEGPEECGKGSEDSTHG